MLGHTLFFTLSRAEYALDIIGTVRTTGPLAAYVTGPQMERLVPGVDAYDFRTIESCVERIAPDVLINCIGLIRQLPEGQQPLPCIEINARFPHLLVKLCAQRNIRLIHYSTDCVFNGKKGAPYTEDDSPSATDIYGLSKYLGEVREAPALTIRTSIIGHELRNGSSLVEWFLAQKGAVKGYTNALYTGLPAAEHARVLAEYILPNAALNGLYHVASAPISKYELLRLLAAAYHKDTAIIPDGQVVEDKRLSGDRFHAATGYRAPQWPALVAAMRENHLQYTEKNQ